MSIHLPNLRGAWGVYALAPPDIGNRVFWWNAAGTAGGSFSDQAATVPAANNVRVGSIKGAEGTKFTQAVVTDQPLFLLNRQNALPGLYFQRSRIDHLEDPPAGFLSALQDLDAFTIMVVWKPTVADACALSFRDNADDGIYMGTGSANQIVAYRRGNMSAGNQVDITAAANFGVASAAILTFPGFSATMGLYDNHGNSDTAATDSADGGAWDNARIGAKTNLADGWEGDIYEIIIWDEAADGTQRTAAFAYATSKWGLT